MEWERIIDVRQSGIRVAALDIARRSKTPRLYMTFYSIYGVVRHVGRRAAGCEKANLDVWRCKKVVRCTTLGIEHPSVAQKMSVKFSFFLKRAIKVSTKA